MSFRRIETRSRDSNRSFSSSLPAHRSRDAIEGGNVQLQPSMFKNAQPNCFRKLFNVDATNCKERAMSTWHACMHCRSCS